MERFWQYVGECLQILYWAFFKPYTFAKWLREEVHPDASQFKNPFELQAEFATNHRLRRYAGQAWALSAYAPVAILILTGVIYSILTPHSFDWLRSSSLIFGWVIGLLLVRISKNFLRNYLFSFFAGFLTLGLIVAAVIISARLGIYFDRLFLSIILDIAVGVAFGVAGGVAFGVALGVSFVLGVLRIYFWLPEVIWMMLLWFFLPRHQLASYLHLLSPCFDEYTFLPFPFADKFLVAAYRQSPDRVRDTIEYLVASTKQQRLAASVMLQISADYLARCQTLSDIVATTTALDWIPAPQSPQVDNNFLKLINRLFSGEIPVPPPAQIGDSLPTLLEIALDVRSAVASSSAYRQSEALNKPIQRLDRLKKTIALDRAAMPIFASISQKWLEIITTAQKNLRTAISNDAEIPEAYIAGSSLDPESAKDLFKGRSDLMREIERLSLASQPPVLLLYGGRRSGKTSLLKYLPKQLPSDIIPLAIDLQGSASSTTLYGVARFFAEETIRVAKNRNLKLPPIDLEDFDRDPFPALQRWMDRAEQSIKGKRFLWCLDEYERLSEVVAVTNSRAPLNFLRHTIQHRQQHWILLFSGFRTLEELEPYWSDYLINTQSLRVTYLHRTEAIELIQHPIPDFPEIYSPEAIDRILFLTNCQPYLVQLICLCIVTHLNTEKRRLATVADIEAVLPKAFELGTQYFREFWLESLSEAERNLLTQLIHNQQPNLSDRPILKKLCDREVLFDDESQNYPFQIPLIGLYIQKVIGV